MQLLFGGVYKNRRILVTGHTGFKGSWLCKWLNYLDAEVFGYSLKPSTEPNHFDLSNPKVNSHINNIQDLNSIRNFITKNEPEIIFHLAAQPLVIESYEEPLETFTTNIIGTANLLEAARYTDSVKAIIIITTDKCYKNKECIYGYKESDELGGYDPYSASKACTELVTESYRHSFLKKDKTGLLIASARAGNVLGGGDWTSNRIFKDIAIAASEKEKLILRNPESIRPWQHVLEPLSGYLLLGQLLYQNQNEFSGPWNFGPLSDSNITVRELVNVVKKRWEDIEVEFEKPKNYESKYLMLDSSKAYNKLKWKPVWGIDLTINNTIDWYKSYYEKKIVKTDDQIKKFVHDAQKNKIGWALDVA